MARLIGIAMIVAALSGATGVAVADERLSPLAVSGDWAAMAHQPSMLAPADVCVLFNTSTGVAFRASQGELQFRVSNPKWMLPTGVTGNIIIAVRDWKTTLTIDDNADDMVNAQIDDDVTLPMLAAMDKAGSMSVTVGKAQALQVSLVGSARATNAFRTCAGIHDAEKSPGANPFQ